VVRGRPGLALILFKPEHVEPILSGRKTQTRRFGVKRWNVGAVHQAATRLFDSEAIFARLRILDVRREFLADISEADARAEGYGQPSDFLRSFREINHIGEGVSLGYLPVWVVEFERADVR
jgi:hypothetical protein